MCEQFLTFNLLLMKTIFLWLRRKRNGLILEHRVGFDFAMHADWQSFMVLRESNEVGIFYSTQSYRYCWSYCKKLELHCLSISSENVYKIGYQTFSCKLSFQNLIFIAEVISFMSEENKNNYTTHLAEYTLGVFKKLCSFCPNVFG